MFDRIATIPCLAAAACGGAVTLRLGYAPAYTGRGRTALSKTADLLHQTCSCPLSDDDIARLLSQAKPRPSHLIAAGS
jgi:hypothetical protein